MSTNKNIKAKIFSVILMLCWLGYIFQVYRFYSQVKEFITPGSSYMIKILEFTNYRGNELITMLAIFFVLVSASSLFSVYSYQVSSIENQKKILGSVIFANLFFVVIVCILSNVFFSVHLLLFILSVMVVSTSLYISSLLFSSNVSFKKGDIIFSSDAFLTKDQAEDELNQKIDKLNSSKLSGDIFIVDKEYYFEIYATDQLVLNSKGDFIINEEEK